MKLSSNEDSSAVAIGVAVTSDSVRVDLSDGRSVTAPLSWYPRLSHGTRAERAKWRLVGGGTGVHWPLLDEDLLVSRLIAGVPSEESQKSLEKWLASRASARTRR